jgi:hypothetical protein
MQLPFKGPAIVMEWHKLVVIGVGNIDLDMEFMMETDFVILDLGFWTVHS